MLTCHVGLKSKFGVVEVSEIGDRRPESMKILEGIVKAWHS
jgi:hypothetical protein